MQIGPRLELELVKIQEGLSGGSVLYHRYEQRTAEQAATQQLAVEERERLRAQRRRQQEENVQRKAVERRREALAQVRPAGSVPTALCALAHTVHLQYPHPARLRAGACVPLGLCTRWVYVGTHGCSACLRHLCARVNPLHTRRILRSSDTASRTPDLGTLAAYCALAVTAPPLAPPLCYLWLQRATASPAWGLCVLWAIAGSAFVIVCMQ
jgi:hypothetical protein